MVRAVALIGLLGSAFAQVPSVPAPWHPAPAPAGVAALRFQPDHAAIRGLANESHVTLTGVALPGGGSVDLDLQRIDVARRQFRFYVDDVEAPGLLDGLDLSVWRGSVVGIPGSQVLFGASHTGVRGWMHTGSELFHFIPRAAAGDDWYASDVLCIEENELLRAGAQLAFACEQEQVSPTPPAARNWPLPPAQQLLAGPSCGLREAKVALTTDFPLYQRFNNLNAETAYVTTLFTWISDRYELEASTTMTFPYVAFYTTSNDPWTATSSGAALSELAVAWGPGLPNGARVGQLVSGANLGGGVGYLSALCGVALSVAGNLAGNTPFPIVQGPSNWDYIVCAHEIGHNFGAIHTHEFCPPVDQCPPSQYWGGCQTAQVCTSQGTIMSYCHLCGGGTSNIVPTFHPNSQAQMLNEAGCLPYFAFVQGDHPTSFTPDVPVTLNATAAGDAGGLVRLSYRYYGGPFTLVTMTNTGPGTYTATLPPPSCDATPEFYYSLLGGCAPAFDPAGAPTALYTAAIGGSGPVLDDHFQTDLGWTASVSGATAGLWQRGVPVNDPNTTFDPPADFDGSGQCWLTGNTTGNSDVDGGSVILTSPAIDLTGSGQQLSYAYWLRLSNTNGTDMLRVEVSSNGTSGPWVTVATHTSDASTWRTNTVDTATMTSAGVAFTANMRVRVTVNDGGTAGTVEGAFDAFVASRVLCTSTAGSFCRGDGGGGACPCANVGFSGRGCANSVWAQGGGLVATGTPSVAGDTVTLASSSMTGATCVFFQGDAQMAPVVVDDGLGCVTGSVIRLGTKAVSTNSSSYPQGGDLSISVRGAIPPAGATRYYQCFYRNAASFCTAATSNRTNGVVLTWLP
ncbi:MAG: hypothetical protein IPJ77_22125 [Planctomycetes bacterium]|nr:hypothetical protein [Planctomycetota bacterium]